MGFLTAMLGFGIVVQVRQIQTDDLANMRQDDLVKLLDEVTRRNEDLTEERSQLRSDRSQLQSGSDQSEYLKNYANLQAILSGSVEVHGPGVHVTVDDPGHNVAAHDMVHMLEELRNAGADAVSVDEVRLVAGSYFIDTAGSRDMNSPTLSMASDRKRLHHYRCAGNSWRRPGRVSECRCKCFDGRRRGHRHYSCSDPFTDGVRNSDHGNQVTYS